MVEFSSSRPSGSSQRRCRLPVPITVCTALLWLCTSSVHGSVLTIHGNGKTVKIHLPANSEVRIDAEGNVDVTLTDTVVANGEAPKVTGNVFVAAEDVPAGNRLRGKVLRMEAWPAEKVPEGAMTRLGDIEGRVLKIPIYAGEPILEKKLYARTEGDGSVRKPIPEGSRLATVTMDSADHDALLLPPDRVDVILHVRLDSAQPVAVSKHSIVENVEILSVDDLIDGQMKPIRRRFLLEVSLEQYRKLEQARKLGKLQLIRHRPREG